MSVKSNIESYMQTEDFCKYFSIHTTDGRTSTVALTDSYHSITDGKIHLVGTISLTQPGTVDYVQFIDKLGYVLFSANTNIYIPDAQTSVNFVAMIDVSWSAAN